MGVGADFRICIICYKGQIERGRVCAGTVVEGEGACLVACDEATVWPREKQVFRRAVSRPAMNDLRVRDL